MENLAAQLRKIYVFYGHRIDSFQTRVLHGKCLIIIHPIQFWLGLVSFDPVLSGATYREVESH